MHIHRRLISGRSRLDIAVFHHKWAWANGIGLERLERLAVATNKHDVCMSSKSVCPDRSFYFVILILELGIENLFEFLSLLMEDLNTKMDRC